MPIVNGVGFSETTETKNDHFQRILSMHFRMARGAMKHAWADKTYYYFDLTAGPGRYSGTDGRDVFGSPLWFLKLAHEQNLQHVALMIEREPENYDQLFSSSLMYPHIFRCADIRFGDSETVFPEWIRDNPARSGVWFGLLYIDPSGNPPPFDLLSEVSALKMFERIDFLLSCSATTIKRWRCNPKMVYHDSLEESLRAIHKKYWVVRKPVGAHQWTFLLGTNWNSFPQYDKIGFYRADCENGREILRRLNLTSKEATGCEQLSFL